MKEGPDIAKIATLIGDPARANILTALMSGKELTATELAAEASISAQTTSFHLKKLNEGGLLTQRKQGRHRYYSLANENVADVLGGLMGLAVGAGHTRLRTGPRDKQLRKARSCYNHLAGSMGTRLFRALITMGYIKHTGEGLLLTKAGLQFIKDFGIDHVMLQAGRVPICRECLDWSERRPHLAGSLGRALLARFEVMGWARRDKHSRAILFSKAGEKEFNQTFK